jgi:hypothetical protein
MKFEEEQDLEDIEWAEADFEEWETKNEKR